MPHAWDRRQPSNDKDPTRNDLDYGDPGGVIDDGAQQTGGLIHDLFSGFGKLFNLPTPQEVLSGLEAGAEAVWNGVAYVAKLIGGVLDPFQIPILDPSKIFNLPNLFDDVVDIATGIFNGWFGGGGTGTAAEVTYTIEAIKDAVINGYTVHTITSSETNWTVPSHTEIIGIVVGGGQNGSGGSGNSGVPGGDGGLNGSFLAQPLDLTGITALDIQIGTAGNKSYIRQANTTTPHTGTVVLESPIQGGVGGIATAFGLTATSSTPGDGGKGGTSGPSYTSGRDGTPSGLAVGGTGGNRGSFGGPGGAGGSVSAGSSVKCGGGGGGGGGGAQNTLNGGGKGGAGGYPGGGGGGGGSANNWTAGAGGAGAPGVVWIFYR